MNILQSPTFKKQVKKLHKNQKIELDNAIKKIVNDPYVGDMKKGDLSGIQVYKFKMINQLTLLAYKFYESELQLILLTLGTHENFYRDLKR
ncbi:MAG: type II toxin-antitoxin system RelE/ParE family toxin [bacterium]